MVSKHIIIKNGKEKELILFLDFNYEFSSMENVVKNGIKKYLNDNKINFTGKILLAVGTLVIATFSFKNNILKFESFNNDSNIVFTQNFSKINSTPSLIKNSKEETDKKHEELPKKVKKDVYTNTKPSIANKGNNKNEIIIDKNTKKKSKLIVNQEVTVYRSGGIAEVMDLESYIIGVVAAEMPASFNIEALKSQAVVARTYALKAIKTGKKLTDTVSTQAYIDKSQMKNKWGSEFSKYYTKIKNAVDDTKGIYITYNGEIIDAVYHSTSNGFTEDSIEVWGYTVPYLKSVESSWDKNVSGYEKTVTKSLDDILKIFGIDYLNNIEIIERNPTGRISQVKVGEDTYSGVDIRNLLSLRSTDFDIEIRDNNVIITTRGYGHGVGMSQYGANAMANRGYTYDKIIKYYYTGVKINKL